METSSESDLCYENVSIRTVLSSHVSHELKLS